MQQTKNKKHNQENLKQTTNKKPKQPGVQQKTDKKPKKTDVQQTNNKKSKQPQQTAKQKSEVMQHKTDKKSKQLDVQQQTMIKTTQSAGKLIKQTTQQPGGKHNDSKSRKQPYEEHSNIKTISVVDYTTRIKDGNVQNKPYQTLNHMTF